ncbi:MAG: GTPase [Planctomycetota bacterium]|nr:GTPase [Planctomycetota bacterium]
MPRASALDTIAALASPGGAGERAVLRVSGPRAAEVVERTCSLAGEPLRPSARGAQDVELHDGEGAQPALLLWMPGPRSFTAEDVAELHLVGHPGLVDLALRRVLDAGARLAEPGEFTRRAFENGRIDLTQAEGVAALVSARTDAERRAALALLEGGLGERLGGIRDGLEAVRALAEASLDFDEADTGHVPTEELARRTGAVLDALKDALRWERQRSRGAEDLVVCLAGAPNAGKSTLFNRLAEGELRAATGPALVSDVAGTTRDPARGRWNVQPGSDLGVELVDTAGLFAGGAAPSALDERAVARARAELGAADLVLVVADASRPGEQVAALAREVGRRGLLVWNKIDLAGAASRPPEALLESAASGHGWVAVSAGAGRGLGELARACASALETSATGASVAARAGLAARHVEALQVAQASGRAAAEGLALRAPLDLVAQELREATDALDGISGRTTPEDLLSRIFARFCLGK